MLVDVVLYLSRNQIIQPRQGLIDLGKCNKLVDVVLYLSHIQII